MAAVTLDDEEAAPVGLSAGARGTFGGLSVLVKWIKSRRPVAAAEPLVQIMGSIIGHHQRLARLAAGEGDGDDRRLMTLVEGRDVLAYTTGAAGARRFARALRARLLAIGP